METKREEKCLVCGGSEEQVPLLEVKFKGEKYFICPQHIPILIHEPGRLTGLLPGADELQAG